MTKFRFRHSLRSLLSLALCGGAMLLASVSAAAEHRLEPLAEAAPTEGLSPEIAKELAATGHRVIKGKSRTLCDIWFCKSWPGAADFKATNEILYPFQVGQLIGVVRFGSKGGDYRGQAIEKGLYTIRYALQPVDGNHVGTSATRDFLVLVKAEDDKSVAPIAEKALMKLSAAAAGTKHPAMFALHSLQENVDGAALVEDAKNELWLLRVAGQLAIDGKTKPLPLEAVIVGEGKH